MSNPVLHKTVFLAATAETVWSFLTEKDKMAQWFNPSNIPSDTDLALGEDFAIMSDADTTAKLCWGTVTEMEPPNRLVYQFTVKPLGGAMTTVTWTLKEEHGGTLLTLEHEGIAEAAGEATFGLLSGLDAGWDNYLGNFRGLFAEKKY